jgi:hypothetical protein
MSTRAYRITVDMLARLRYADRVSYRWRTQRPIPTAPSTRLNDGVAIAVGLVVYVVFEHWLHARWIGVQPLPM